MKFLRLSIFFLISFTISFILLRTFSQEVFKAAVPARILGYSTPTIPIYFFIAGSFILGLFIGLLVAVYYFITTKAESLKKSKKIKELTKEVDFLADQQKKLSSSGEPTLVEPDQESQEEDLPPNCIEHEESSKQTQDDDTPDDSPVKYDSGENKSDDWGEDDTDENGKPFDDTITSFPK